MASPSRRPITINAISWARKTTSEGPLAISAARASVIATTLNVTSALSRISSISSRRCATDQHLHIRVSFQAYSANASSDKLGRESNPGNTGLFRPELRYEHSYNAAAYDHGRKNSQVIVAADLILLY